MIVLNDLDVLQAVCKGRGKWGIMSHFQFRQEVDVKRWRDEIYDATKGLIDTSENSQFWVANSLVLHNSSAVIYMLFDTEAEMEDAFFNRIYGDDNADMHGYDGALHTIRSVTCTPEGEWQNENS